MTDNLTAPEWCLESMVPRRVSHWRRVDRARLPLADDNGGGRVSDPYIPARIRGGARPSVSDCVGCPDLENRRYNYRTIRICGVTGTTFRQTATCPKMTTTRPEMASISGGDYQ